MLHVHVFFFNKIDPYRHGTNIFSVITFLSSFCSLYNNLFILDITQGKCLYT